MFFLTRAGVQEQIGKRRLGPKLRMLQSTQFKDRQSQERGDVMPNVCFTSSKSYSTLFRICLIKKSLSILNNVIQSAASIRVPLPNDFLWALESTLLHLA